MDEMSVRLKQTDDGMDEMSVRFDDGTDSGEASFFGHCPSGFRGSFMRPASREASLFFYYMLDDGTDSGASFFGHCPSGFRGSFIVPLPYVM
jgi:hypothetical protein